MAKVKLTDSPDNLPPMPATKDEVLNSEGSTDFSSSPSTGSTNDPAVSEELAGDLIALPFDAWHMFNDAAMPLSEVEKDRLAGPFSRILEKYGLGKIAKDEILLGFYLTAITYGRIKAVKEAKLKEKIPVPDESMPQ